MGTESEGEHVLFEGHPAWRSMLELQAKGLLAMVVAGVIAGLATAVAARHVQVGWVIVAVIVVFIVAGLTGLVRRNSTTYRITNQRLTIQKGLLSRELHETQLERVQNVSTRQSLPDRLLRIGTVDFDTAGEAGFDFAFRGVAAPRAVVHTVHEALHVRASDPL
ncbi:MAG TPA: PH domain-containing protein [Solirubrobacteraceae bacterium]|nr:PH domain-containing protein [Solirubrobacteraceae bacterium]